MFFGVSLNVYIILYFYISGIIGDYYSSVTAPIAGFAKDFSIPQISFSATAPSLSDKQRYPYFLRTTPSDVVMVEVSELRKILH